MKELQHLNKKPKLEYLRTSKPKTKRKIRFRGHSTNDDYSDVFRKNYAPASTSSKGFGKMIQAAKGRSGSMSGNKVHNIISHMSQLRTEPLNQPIPEDIVETIKRGVTVLELKYNEFVLAKPK